MKRYPHNLSHTVTGTNDMGLCYPTTIFEVFPGDSFKIQAQNLTRFLPQVAPTMQDVFVGVDNYIVPWRQLFEKLGIDWDAFLTGGEDGTNFPDLPMITIPASGYEPGSLADWLGYPTNYTDPDTGEKVVVAAGMQLNALPVVAYMHVINENYRDQNFVKKIDLKKYQEFLDGTYQFADALGNPLGYQLCRNAIFPKAWSRDYFGRAMPNTQRGVPVNVPLGTTGLVPTTAPVVGPTEFIVFNGSQTNSFPSLIGYSAKALDGSSDTCWVVGVPKSVSVPNGFRLQKNVSTVVPSLSQSFSVTPTMGDLDHITRVQAVCRVHWFENDVVTLSFHFEYQGKLFYVPVTDESQVLPTSYSKVSEQYADLSNIQQTGSIGLLALRLASRMQRFGERLQKSGARAVEFTLEMFGVRIPDDRVQRPIFYGSFRMPVVFSEVLQTSQTSDTAPLGHLGGHGITGGVNNPIHIKCIEHGYFVSIMHIMPRSQYQNIVPKYLLRKNHLDIPLPMMQHVGNQPVKRVEIFPNSKNPDENFGYVPCYSELSHVPSSLHGHMKDTFLHWTMARVYKDEPVLSAAWRYERPTDRTMAVKNEDQMQICIGYKISARRPFQRNPEPGIHIV